MQPTMAKVVECETAEAPIAGHPLLVQSLNIQRGVAGMDGDWSIVLTK